jgi:hypothetical protein
MKTTFRVSLLVLSIVAGASAQENYSTGWSGHKHVIVNSFAAGTTVPVVKFPLLVRLDSTQASIFTAAKAGGADLRFTKANNTMRLEHQIESWNATARTAAIWVLVDTIPANRNNFSLRMHWGNNGAADSSSGAKVFDTTNAYQAVWHMGGSTQETDATLNGFTATQNGSPASAAGAAGTARVVSAGNYFRAGGTAAGKLNFPEGGNYTLSAWVFANSLPSAGTIVSKHDNAFALKLNADANSWEFFEFGTDATAAGWNWVNGSADGSLGTWTYLTGVHSSTDVAIFVNGVRMDGGPANATSTAARVLNTDVTIGAQATSNTAVQRPFDGVIDEVRMSSAARDPDWILLEYATQKAGTTVVSLSDTVPASVAPRMQARNDFSVKSSGDGLLFAFDGAGIAKAHVALRDMRGVMVAQRVSAAKDGILAWDGRDAGGRLVPQGVYAVRIRLMDAHGKFVRALERKIPLTR